MLGWSKHWVSANCPAARWVVYGFGTPVRCPGSSQAAPPCSPGLDRGKWRQRAETPMDSPMPHIQPGPSPKILEDGVKEFLARFGLYVSNSAFGPPASPSPTTSLPPREIGPVYGWPLDSIFFPEGKPDLRHPNPICLAFGWAFGDQAGFPRCWRGSNLLRVATWRFLPGIFACNMSSATWGHPWRVAPSRCGASRNAL